MKLNVGSVVLEGDTAVPHDGILAEQAEQLLALGQLGRVDEGLVRGGGDGYHGLYWRWRWSWFFNLLRCWTVAVTLSCCSLTSVELHLRGALVMWDKNKRGSGNDF